ncbi:hypothetical protein [Glutamicibacter ardleyensis]|uniref:hypothetical protein n=1 Tax=Glutamicibacter ardleyensis TaxID=225894 RepID=UPI003FD348E2
MAQPAPAPVYPTTESSAPAKDNESVLIPLISAHEDNFYLAVSDAAQASVDQQGIVDQVRESMGATHAKILVGVDKKPNNLKGAAQLVRGLLLFGDSDALSDDWLEHGKDRGYVGKGWIVVGVMLPERAGAPTEVFVDPGRNVRAKAEGATERIHRAGQQYFDSQKYTQGIIEVSKASATELRAPKKAMYLSLQGWGVLALVALAAVIVVFIMHQRLRRAHAATKRAQRGQMLVDLLRQRALRLEKYRAPLPVAEPNGPSGRASEAINAVIPSLNARALLLAQNYQDGGALSIEELAQMEASFADQELLIAATKTLNTLLEAQRGENSDWKAIVLTHRERLEDTAQFLNLDDVGQLHCLPQLRTMIIEHTNRLDEIQNWVQASAPRQQSAVQVLDELWRMRTELQENLSVAITQARDARLELVDSLRQRMDADGAREVFSDPLTTLDAALVRAHTLTGENLQENS